MPSHAAFTIATGKSSYFHMAVNLARSFERWNRSNELRFYIVTDLDVPLPKDLKRSALIKVDTNELPRGFSAKLHIDRLMPADRSLFLDADCLLMRSLDPIFEAFKGKPVGVFGHVFSDGEHFGNVAEICERLKIPWLPRFNGGVYYVEKSGASMKILSDARELEKSYDDIGFHRLRGQPDEEMLISASLAKHGVTPVANDGRYYADFQWWPVVRRFKMATGDCTLYNPPVGHPRHQSTFPADLATPIVVHFLGHHVTSVLYRRASLELFLGSKGVPGSSIIALGAFVHLDLWDYLKNLLRPIYRALFGYRPIRRSDVRTVVE